MKILSGICFCTFLGCALFVKVPTFNHIPKSDRFVMEPRIYCKEFILLDDKRCSALVFFPSGDVIGHTTSFSLYDLYFFSNSETLYDKSTFDAQWGKYWLLGDTLYYEFAHYANMGGAVYYPKISRKTKLVEDTLVIIPQFLHTFYYTEYFWANDTLTYIRIEYPDINNIDPSKAWINQ